MKYFDDEYVGSKHAGFIELDIATPISSSGLVNFQYVQSLINAKLPHRVFMGVHFEGGHFIDRQRNSLVEKSLERTDEGYIMFIDSDIAVNPLTIKRMLLRAKEEEIEVQTSIYMSKRPPYHWQLFEIDKFGNLHYAFPKMRDIDPFLGKVFRVDASGAGCLLVSKKVFEKIERPWFSTEYTKRGFISEDIYFCNKLREAKIPLRCNGEIVSHCSGYSQYPDLFNSGYIAEGAATVRWKESESLLKKNAMSLQ